jgi:hypothetical protein
MKQNQNSQNTLEQNKNQQHYSTTTNQPIATAKRHNDKKKKPNTIINQLNKGKNTTRKAMNKANLAYQNQYRSYHI